MKSHDGGYPMKPVKTLLLAGLFSAVGCCGRVDLKLERASLIGEQDTHLGRSLVIEVVADGDVIDLQQPGGYLVHLCFGVDLAGPRPKPYGFRNRLPFHAQLLEADPPGNRTTRWAVRPSLAFEQDGRLVGYDLEDGREHVLRTQIEGFKYPGFGYWASNELEIRVPKRRPASER